MLWLRSTHANFRIKLLFLFIFWKVGPSTKMRSTIFLVWNPQFLQVNYPYIPYKTGLLCRHQTDTTWGPPEPHPLPCRLVTGGGLRIFAKSKSFGWKTSGSSDVGQQQCLWKKNVWFCLENNILFHLIASNGVLNCGSRFLLNIVFLWFGFWGVNSPFWCRSRFHPSPGWLCRNQCTENEQLIPTAMFNHYL